jgi:hypothetical protein
MPWISDRVRPTRQLAIAPPVVLPSAIRSASAPQTRVISRLNSPAYTTPTDASPPPSRAADARLGAIMDR